MTMDNFIQHSESKSIFIVDDDIDYLNNITRYMIARGYHVVSFASAEEYLQGPDVGGEIAIVLDISLGGMSGIELRRYLSATRTTVPVVFITARDDEATRLVTVAIANKTARTAWAMMRRQEDYRVSAMV